MSIPAAGAMSKPPAHIQQKLHLARVKALNGLGDFKRALEAAREPCLAAVAGVAEEVARAREGVAAAKRAEKNVWGKGLAGGGGGEGASPQKHVQIGGVTAAPSASPRSPATAATPWEPTHRGAGHTPHPRKGGAGGGGEEEGEGEEEGGGASGSAGGKSAFHLRSMGGAGGTSTQEAEAEESGGLSWGMAAVALGALGVAGYFALKAMRK
jgi:hypothetical protein